MFYADEDDDDGDDDDGDDDDDNDDDGDNHDDDNESDDHYLPLFLARKRTFKTKSQFFAF